jgi:hypothetical protein
VALAAVDERVERTHDVLAIDAEVEREVVARARRDAGVGQIELRGDRGDDGLRAVAAGHRQPVGTAGNGVAHELLEVPRWAELDRLDPARPGFVGHLETGGLATAGLGLEEQHRPLRRRHPRQADAEAEGRSRTGEAQHERGDDHQLLEQAGADEQEDPAERDRAARELLDRHHDGQAEPTGTEHDRAERRRLAGSLRITHRWTAPLTPSGRPAG